jgi:2-polyprenyl-6-methoxyphenol hydroxylase-like FAD-dependent oxidoreductase
MTSKLPTLIVGGGIGGLATALALARRGRAVHVVEKSPDFGELGAGLQLAPNAMAVLDRLGLTSALAAHAVHPRRLVWMDALSAERITEIDLGEPFRRRYGHPYIVMHRGCSRRAGRSASSRSSPTARSRRSRISAMPRAPAPPTAALGRRRCWSAPMACTRRCAA